MAQREERERMTGHRPGGRPLTPGPRDSDLYNFTDSESRIMKSSTHAGFEQDYNAQVAVDQRSLFIVGYALSNHPNDSQEAEPTLAAIPLEKRLLLRTGQALHYTSESSQRSRTKWRLP
jgi:hypothetical protein